MTHEPEALAAAIRALPYEVMDDYAEVRQDERERIITALAQPAENAKGGEVAATGKDGLQVAAAEERDALLSALGWKTGPFPDAGTRKVVLEDSAALRPEMVKARRRADDAEAARDLWRFIAGERVEATRSGLLIRVWNQMQDERKRRIKAEAALAGMRSEPPTVNASRLHDIRDAIRAYENVLTFTPAASADFRAGMKGGFNAADNVILGMMNSVDRGGERIFEPYPGAFNSLLGPESSIP
ncbi:hypothetical protein [Sphingobium sp. Z007]|uniref:hypothetical protein n=1 Tax=Sphingobium sp. Z007 TaxID=627495 RepID=UPI000B49740E|nr:hypothetical protein [Sphingobium sp. Z007]